MIDTDKYTGHTPKPWGIKNAPHNITHLYGGNDTKICSIQTPDSMFAKTKGELKLSRECNTNARLIQDAPLLFAEVKRLREQNKLMVDYFRFMRVCGLTDEDWIIINEWIGDEEE